MKRTGKVCEANFQEVRDDPGSCAKEKVAVDVGDISVVAAVKDLGEKVCEVAARDSEVEVLTGEADISATKPATRKGDAKK